MTGDTQALDEIAGANVQTTVRRVGERGTRVGWGEVFPSRDI